MKEAERREAARKFINHWRGKGDEKQDSQLFWVSLLQDVYGMENVKEHVQFERRVIVDGQQKYIDVYLPETRVMIEQKSMTKDLSKPEPQSGGISLTPYQQAKRYANNMPLDEMPRYIVTCNFQEFRIHDQNKPGQEPEVIQLDALQDAAYRMEFLVKKEHASLSEEMQISMQAGEIVGKLYDAFYKQYRDPTNEKSQKSLNALCVRLVFCLYAEDSGLFGSHAMFHDYLDSYQTKHMRNALINLFRVLDQPENERDPYMNEDLAAFPYVNGGLFSDEDIEIPPITDEIRNLLLNHASEDFDWSNISPTIFGAVFESTLNPETRRSGGMHYTSIENIHKVIDPLFLDDLRAELAEIGDIAVVRTRKNRLEKFQDKLASLTFLDPACGSGNFLTETYLSLRRLENEVLRQRIAADRSEVAGQIMLDFGGTYSVKVSIGQFYGIEINDFAVTVAKTALWISEEQMIRETQEIIHTNIDFLPLKSYANIVQGNALRIDWKNVVAPENMHYLIGNPPFVGYKMQTSAQKEDIRPLFGNAKNIDYVSGWYYKAAKYIQGTNIQVAFVSTNSITQGEQVSAIWEKLIKELGVQINFAYRSFVWDSETNQKAHVHCVIIGFGSAKTTRPKFLFEENIPQIVAHINPYLVNGPDIFISRRSVPLSKCEPMLTGSEPRDGGFLLVSSEERGEILSKYPELINILPRFITGEDFINNKYRYCLWLKNADPSIMKKYPFIKNRLKSCKEFRQNSKQAQAHKMADYPALFVSERQPATKYLLIPQASSENRRYIPIGYMDADIIVSNTCFTVSNATLYTFGVIASNVHMAWMRTVCGRLEMRYRYSNAIVYNNFPWPTPTPAQKDLIEQTAQGILDARALYPDSSLADLYDPLTMPPELRKAHDKNNIAVMRAYEFSTKMSEAECVAELMKLYQELTK